MPLIFIASIVGAVAAALGNASQAALLCEAFPVHLRYSGFAITAQIGTVLGGAIAPLVATALLAATGTTASISCYVVALSVLSLVGTVALRSAPDRFAAPSMTATGPERAPQPRT